MKKALLLGLILSFPSYALQDCVTQAANMGIALKFTWTLKSISTLVTNKNKDVSEVCSEQWREDGWQKTLDQYREPYSQAKSDIREQNWTYSARFWDISRRSPSRVDYQQLCDMANNYLNEMKVSEEVRDFYWGLKHDDFMLVPFSKMCTLYLPKVIKLQEKYGKNF